MTIPDNATLYDRYERDSERKLSRRPVCACCGEYIQGEYMWDIDGYYCEECKDIYLANIRREVEG